MNENFNNRFVSLELLRGIAAIQVAFFHFLWVQGHDDYLVYSKLSVEAFFILSGFVLAPQLEDVANGKKDLKIFLLRRLFRTLPIFIIAVLIFNFYLGGIQFDRIFKKLFFIDYLNFDYGGDFYAITWSLAVEEWFYVLFPIIFILLKGRFEFSKICVSLFLILICITQVFLAMGFDFEDIRRTTFLRFDAILYGVILRIGLEKLGEVRYIKVSVISLLIGSLLYAFTAYEGFLFILSPLLFSCIILCFVRYEKFLRQNFLSFICIKLGQISYSTYLFHLLFAYFVVQFNISFFAKVALYLALTLSFSYAIFVCVERPITNLRPNWDEKTNMRFNKDGIFSTGILSVLFLILFVFCSDYVANYYIKNHLKRPNAEIDAFYDPKVKLASKNLYGAIDPLLGYAHPKNIDLDLKKIGLKVQNTVVSFSDNNLGKKVVILGGSTSDPISAAAKGRLSWPHFLQEECSEACSVHSLAVGGYGSPQDVIRMIRDALPLKPDIIIAMHGPNELNRLKKYPFNTVQLMKQTKLLSTQGLINLGGFFPSLNFIINYTSTGLDTGATKNEVFYGMASHETDPFQRWSTNIEIMRAVALSQNIDFYAAIHPIVGYGNFEGEAELKKRSRRGAEYYESVHDFVSSASYYCDTTEWCVNAIKVFDNKDEVLFGDIRHPNELGNKLIGEFVHDKIFRQ